MTIQLGPGGNTALDPALEHIQVALAWEKAAAGGAAPELDACAFLVNAVGKVRTDQDFVFYNQGNSPCNAVRLQPAPGIAQRQVFDIDLKKIPEEVAKIEFALAFHPQPGRQLGFASLRAAAIELAAADNTLIQYTINPEAHPERALLFGELYRHQGNWKFRALGQGFMGGLEAMAGSYGVAIAAEAPAPSERPELTLVPKAPESAPPPPPSALSASRDVRGRPVEPPQARKTKRSKRVPLVLAGAAAVFMLSRCDSDDRVRYVYANQADCVEEWGPDDCDYDDGRYYAYVSNSHPKFKTRSNVGGKALRVVRSGFGSFASRFGGSGS